MSGVNIIVMIALAVLGLVLGPLECKLLNVIPAVWLCDYDEKPTEELLRGKRFKLFPHGAVMGVSAAAALSLTVLTTGVTVQLPFVILLTVILLAVSASDAKYTIIPDQFTVAAAVISIIFAVVDLFGEQIFISKWYQPLLGGIIGGGVLILLDILSTLLLKKAGFGFGDVKLLAALGLFFGVKHTVILMVLSFLIATLHFLIIIFSGKARKGIYMPMGPYICIAALLTIILQPKFAGLFEMYRILLSMDVLP